MEKMSELFGCMVFNDALMKERLPKDVYLAVNKTKAVSDALTREVADVVANAMKYWAI